MDLPLTHSSPLNVVLTPYRALENPGRFDHENRVRRRVFVVWRMVSNEAGAIAEGGRGVVEMAAVRGGEVAAAVRSWTEVVVIGEDEHVVRSSVAAAWLRGAAPSPKTARHQPQCSHRHRPSLFSARRRTKRDGARLACAFTDRPNRWCEAVGRATTPVRDTVFAKAPPRV